MRRIFLKGISQAGLICLRKTYMSINKAYDVLTGYDRRLMVSCPNCSCRIGSYYIQGGSLLLLIGNIYLRELRGWCNDCDKEFNFVASNNAEKVLRRAGVEEERIEEMMK
jgi:hypothetical protein